MRKDSPEPGLCLLDGLIGLFLALPLPFFFVWFKWPVALSFFLLAALGFHRTFQGIRLRRFELDRRLLFAIGVVSIAWTAIAGVGHFFYANADWLTRDAVLRDLVETAWPPRYQGDGPYPVILRAPVGYYLPAAAVGSLLGLHAGDFALYAWTVAGFTLFLCGACSLFPTVRQRTICCIVLVGFGGLDLPGFLLLRGRLPEVGQHIEWWAQFAQYSSNSTLLFWVPNHALPAWLGIVLILRHWRRPELVRLAPLMAAAIPLWAPLAAVGLAPFFLVAVNWRRDYRRLFSLQASLPLLALAAVVARYLTLDSQTIPRGWAASFFDSPATFLLIYGVFCLFEFGLLALVLWRLRAGSVMLGVSVLVLLVLPFFRFGQGNDLVMRASIPALAVLALATVHPLAEHARSAWGLGLMVLLGVGALGAAQEPARAFLLSRWALTGWTLAEVSGELPPNYVANLNQPGLAALMREPSLVSSTAAMHPRSQP